MIDFGVIVHGGAGAPRTLEDGCAHAADRAMAILASGGHALDAVTEAARLLEDDGRYNAGTGSCLRMDGETIEMDASLMDSSGRIGVVAAIRHVRNPILVARRVMETPHLILCGEGAERFARALGFPPHPGPTPGARASFEKFREILQEGKIGDLRPNWAGVDLGRIWNFPTPLDQVRCDTIGAVALDRAGNLAAANSTGGAYPMMLGRLGDSPIPGCGLYASPAAAACATGLGEEIIRREASRAVCERIRQGAGVQDACQEIVGQFPQQVPFGIIAISRRGAGLASNREMAQAVRVEVRK